MRYFIFLLLIFILISTATTAQKQLSMEDAVVGQYTYLHPERLQSMQWLNDETYVFVSNDTLWSVSTQKNHPNVFLTLDELNQSLAPTNISLVQLPGFTIPDNQHIQFFAQQHLFLHNPTNQKYQKDANKLDFDYNKKKQLPYVKGQNLFILNEEGETQITFETQPGIVCGQEVHRREFGIEKGTFWSASGKYLAFYRKDESMVKDYPLVDYMARQAEHTPIKYPMAGMTSHEVTLGIYNCESGETIYLNTGKPADHYLTNISWGPAEKYIYLAELNREQNHMQLNQYAVETGEKIKTLFEETSTTYVEPQHPLQFSQTNPETFYYWSRKDGWDHIYLYHVSGKPIKQITQGEWEVTDFYGADAKDKSIFIQATKESPVERHLYKVDVTTGNMQQLDTSAGTHRALFSPSKTNLIDQWNSFEVPSKTDLVRASGKLIRNIQKAENPLKDYQLGKNEIFTIKAADKKTDLYCRMILPHDFDPSQKYPVIIYVYGGPHAQLINNTWLNDAGLWPYYMAEKGYIAFTLDNRGSANRGQAFEEVIHRQLGITETDDQMQGVAYLKKLPYVDTNRIGVHGWSFGGFMTLNLMLRHPDVFKVGVAGGPVVDWEMYEIMYGERYMDMPQENPEGYKNSNMLNHVDQLNGKLMLIHGVQDDTVVMQHSMKFLRECIKQNKQIDFFAYPTHPHNVRGIDRIHLMNKVSQYFMDYLPSSN